MSVIVYFVVMLHVLFCLCVCLFGYACIEDVVHCGRVSVENFISILARVQDKQSFLTSFK